MLATNLGNYNDYDICMIDNELIDLIENFDNIPNNYEITYTVGKYIIEQYGSDYLYQMISNQEHLDNTLPSVFKQAKEWSKAKVK